MSLRPQLAICEKHGSAPHSKRKGCFYCYADSRACARAEKKCSLPKLRAPAPKRTSAPRKKRNSPLARAERALWKAFARYVKDRDGNSCVSCPAVGLEGHNWHAGHMYSADGFSILRYHPLNVHSQCGRCNYYLKGNAAAYASRFIELYGMDQFAYLSEIRREGKQWKEHELRELIEALKVGPADYELKYMELIGHKYTPAGVR